MPRSTNSVFSRRRRKKILKLSKGFYGARSKVYTVAKNAVEKSLIYAFSGRKKKKKYFRSLWIQRINAGVRQYGISYSVFMKKLSDKNIKINRKFLSYFSMNDPDSLKKIVDHITS
ncbi:MAG: 50S ribosomal protein L20 [Flavobacteriales bacterium]|jgi:large subunit ribosomal protein L20|uniref:50S ribosomal protein L20 n=1 Tax=Blattabacterium sp. (Mastotermes darwiniensis) TaxID=39768 RepID=UPI000231DDC4|nr:50S ribosomal protein L20 [Blattabacterium sp. (Mastotermes darwiniensis)]AER40504.1 50S ribosomal protein L20 [Blattabacterium sp. (Mastotermes darwiniensis) str. MADAR]MDR1804981.1 50S ribosomal protein L20 [Flavobacteriales bacterium]